MIPGYSRAKAEVVFKGNYWIEMTATFPGAEENDEWGLWKVGNPGQASFHPTFPYEGEQWYGDGYRPVDIQKTNLGKYISANGCCYIRCELINATTKPWTTIKIDGGWVYIQ